jgi:hypothetical protein
MSKRTRIVCKKREIRIGNMRLKFDDRVLPDKQVKEMNTVLKASCETVVKVPTNSEEVKVGSIRKTELL